MDSKCTQISKLSLLALIGVILFITELEKSNHDNQHVGRTGI